MTNDPKRGRRIAIGITLIAVAAIVVMFAVGIYSVYQETQVENAKPGPTPLPTRTAEQLKQYVAEHNTPYVAPPKTGHVEIGMTDDQCRYQRGQPDKINRTTTAFGTHEQWCYGKWCERALYFDNGILTAIQD